MISQVSCWYLQIFISSFFFKQFCCFPVFMISRFAVCLVSNYFKNKKCKYITVTLISSQIEPWMEKTFSCGCLLAIQAKHFLKSSTAERFLRHSRKAINQNIHLRHIRMHFNCLHDFLFFNTVCIQYISMSVYLMSGFLIKHLIFFSMILMTVCITQ